MILNQGILHAAVIGYFSYCYAMEGKVQDSLLMFHTTCLEVCSEQRTVGFVRGH